VRIIGIGGLLRTVLLHAETAFAAGFRGPVHQGHGSHAGRARREVRDMKRVETGAYAGVLEVPVGGDIPNAVLPVETGGTVAAPSKQRYAHHLQQSVVGPFVNPINKGADRVNVCRGIDGQHGYGLRAGGQASQQTQTKNEKRLHISPILIRGLWTLIALLGSCSASSPTNGVHDLSGL